MKKALLFLPLILAACEAPLPNTGSTYRQSETGIAMPVSHSCVVTGVRRVRIVNEPTGGGQLVGVATGAIVGGAIGSNVGRGTGRTVATALGVVGGAAAGSRIVSNIENTARVSPGIEYTVRVDGARTLAVVQNVAPGERILPAGSACRLTGAGRSARVLPAEAWWSNQR